MRPGLTEAHERGWKLGILSNTDRDLIDASVEALGIPFELTIVAGEIGSYKPAYKHWEVFYETTGADRRGYVHVAQSLFHDIEPANELGIPSIWINRLGEPDDPRPTVTLAGVGELRWTRSTSSHLYERGDAARPGTRRIADQVARP